MMKAQIKIIVSKKIAVLNAGLLMYQQHPNEKTMHDIRVDIKSIRSVFFMLEAGPHRKTAKRMHQHLKKMFGEAGMIREWQLEANWLSYNKKLSLLRIMEYTSKIKRANHAFRKNTIINIRLLKRTRQTINQLLKKTDSAFIGHYLQGLLHALLPALDASLLEQHWHVIRKKIKRIIHAVEWMGDIRVPVSVKVFIRDMNKLQEAIGNWHDLVMLDSSLFAALKKVEGRAIAMHEWNLARTKLWKDIQIRSEKVRLLLQLMQDRYAVVS